MRTRVLLASVALGVTAATTLAGCGSSDSSSGASSSKSSSSKSSGGDYCKELKADQAFFKSLDDGNTAKLDEAFTKFHQLAADAPDEVAADWKTLDGAITTVQNALKDAGVSFKDLDAIQKGQVPAGVDVKKLQDLAPKLQSLGDQKFETAAKAIETHAKTECKIDISGN